MTEGLPRLSLVLGDRDSNIVSGAEFDPVLEKEHKKLEERVRLLADRFGVPLKDIPEDEIFRNCRALVPGSKEYIQKHLYYLLQQLRGEYGNLEKTRVLTAGLVSWETADGKGRVDDATDADAETREYVFRMYLSARKYSGEVGNRIVLSIKDILPDIETWSTIYGNEI